MIVSVIAEIAETLQRLYESKEIKKDTKEESQEIAKEEGNLKIALGLTLILGVGGAIAGALSASLTVTDLAMETTAGVLSGAEALLSATPFIGIAATGATIFFSTFLIFEQIRQVQKLNELKTLFADITELQSAQKDKAQPLNIEHFAALKHNIESEYLKNKPAETAVFNEILFQINSKKELGFVINKEILNLLKEEIKNNQTIQEKLGAASPTPDFMINLCKTNPEIKDALLSIHKEKIKSDGIDSAYAQATTRNETNLKTQINGFVNRYADHEIMRINNEKFQNYIKIAMGVVLITAAAAALVNPVTGPVLMGAIVATSVVRVGMIAWDNRERIKQFFSPIKNDTNDKTSTNSNTNKFSPSVRERSIIRQSDDVRQTFSQLPRTPPISESLSIGSADEARIAGTKPSGPGHSKFP